MLIINKKYSNLLKGYQRALELDHQLETKWETKYKPKLLGKLQIAEAEKMKEYQNKLDTWQESEKLSIAQWEESERKKLDEWENNEIVRQSIYAAENVKKRTISQQCLEQQKHDKSTWMIAWITSAIMCFGLFLFGLIVKVGVLLGILGFFSTIGLCIFSIVSFIIFIVKSSAGGNPLPRYIPAPKPISAMRISQNKPILPAKSENLIDKYSYPSVISRWQEEIQYKDEGNEYFRNLVQEKPDTVNGTPGEITLLQNIASIGSINSVKLEDNGIYILGLKIGEKADIDGTLICVKGLWILESKYLAGKVLYSFGKWKHLVYVKNYAHRELEGWQEKVYDRPMELDKQWIHEKECVEKLLSKKVKEYPWLYKAINGGLIFTNPNTELNISNCPVFYTQDWFINEHIDQELDNQELTFERRLEIADLLLAGNRKYEKEEVSAVKLADDIYEGIIEYLETQINHPTVY
ncbi:MAG: hypothetical protein CVU43_08400 [Chloroflexi bacterium HGW-Chloroflexi-5]|jgi:hypothetical protein|nr:MAG: hypothetical protein CVU43_08400 [Chloroflexi bacterium HGW-Chloroflexi-5]